MKIRTLAVHLALSIALLHGTAVAAPAPPATHAVVSFLNLFDPHMVQVLSAEAPGRVETARSIVAHLATAGILDEGLAEGLERYMEAERVPRELVVLFLADVANGTEVIDRADLASVEAWLLETLGVVVPTGRDGMLSAEEIANLILAMLEQSDRIASAVRRSYQSPVL